MNHTASRGHNEQDHGTATIAAKGQALTETLTGTSPLRAYQDFIVGSRSWGTLIRYELVAAWGAVLPGAVGLAFRKRFWPRLFAHAGRGAVWGRNIVVRHPGKMWIGTGVVIDDGCYLDAKGSDVGEFRIEDQALIGRNCILSSKGGSVVIGARVNISAACALYSSGGLRIGSDTMLAAHCYVGGGRYEPHGSLETPMSKQELPARGVVIEEDCWLGAGVAVIDGVRVRKGSVVAAGAVVTRDVPPYSVVAGVPAKLISNRAPPSV